MRDYIVKIGGVTRPVAIMSTEDIQWTIQKISVGEYTTGMNQCSPEAMLERLRIELVARSLGDHQ